MELLERTHDLEVLQTLLLQAGDGRGSMLLLGGEAGVGKSALVRHFSAASRPIARVLLGQCDALSTPRPLGPLFDIDDPAITRLLGDDAPRHLLFPATLARLSANTQTTLLVIEDAHWADEATLDFLRYLGRRIETSRALVLVTYRDDEVGPRHLLRRLLGDLANAPGMHRLTVLPLSLDSVTLLGAASGIAPDALYERTRGNPFFVTEILAAGGEIPPTVHDALLARASRVSAAAWTVLEAAAVIGNPIDIETLQAVVEVPDEALDACLESGLLKSDGQAMTFRHELARDAILTSISPWRRPALHADVLRVLEALPDRQRDPAILAHHADEAGDAAAVLRHAPEAARRAMVLRAHREAADQYVRALRYAAALPHEDRALLLEDASHAFHLTARIDQAKSARAAALDLWIKQGDRRKEGENRCHLAILHWADAQMDLAEGEAMQAVQLLEGLAPGPDLAMAYRTLARLRGTILDDNDAIAWGERAIALAEQFGITETLADALITVGVARIARGSFEAGLAQLERSISLSTAAGLDDLTARAHANLGFGFDENYLFGPAALHYTRGIHFCAERDLDNSRLHMTAWLARCQLFLGDWARASELSTAVLAARDLAPVTQFVALLVEGMVRTRRGEPDAGPLLDEALALAQASGSLYRLGPIHAARAEAAFLAGNSARAFEEAGGAFDLALSHRHRWYAGELAYWRWKSGERSAPPDLIADPFAWQIGGDWQRAAAAWDGLGCPYEAARARAESDDEGAWRAALDTFDALGAQPAAAALRRRLRATGLRGIPRGPRATTRSNAAGLTAREIEVVSLLAEGFANQEIADRLYLSARTVENHVASALAKLGASSRAEGAETARELGIVGRVE